jgi:hypothetical protein
MTFESWRGLVFKRATERGSPARARRSNRPVIGRWCRRRNGARFAGSGGESRIFINELAELARMGLSDIAAGVEVTTEQRDRGVATVDDTDVSLAERLADYETALPCSGPTGRDLVRDWLAAELSRSEARELAAASEREFALAAYVETHDTLTGAEEAVASVLAPDPGGDPLADTRSDLDDLQDL